MRIMDQIRYMQQAARNRYARWSSAWVSRGATATIDEEESASARFSPTCSHEACHNILEYKRRARRQKRGGIIAIPLVQLATEDGGSRVFVLMGQNCPTKAMRAGDTGIYSIVTGGADPVDGNCYYKTVRREMAEELKIHIVDDDIEADTWFTHLGSPVFVVHVGEGLSGRDAVDAISISDDNISLTEEARDRIVSAKDDLDLPDTHREMCDLAMVPLYEFPTELYSVEASDVLPPVSELRVQNAPEWPQIPITPLTRDVVSLLVSKEEEAE